MKTSHPTLQAILAIAGSSLLTASLAQAIGITVSDLTPNGDSGSGTRSLSSSLGSVSAPPLIPTTTYTVSGLDLTSVGGGASETIAFDVTFSQTGGSAVQFNGFGNVSVTGGNDNQVEPGETITATLALNAGATSYTGPINLAFTQVRLGGFDGDESCDLITDAGTTTIPEGGSSIQTIDSSFVTISPVDTDKINDAMNLAGYTVEITAGADPSWTGGVDDSWIVSGNWTTGAVPGPGALINFDSNSTANLATVLDQDFELGGIIVTAPTGAVSIGGANSLTIGSSGIDLSASSHDLTISAPVALSAAQSWSVASGQTLNVDGGISGASALGVGGGGTVSVGAAIGPSVPVTIASGGTLKMGASGVLASGAGAVNPTVNGTLDLNGTTQSANAISGNGVIDNTAAGAAELTVGTNNVTSTLGANLQDSNGTLALVKTGSGNLTMTVANSHGGGFTNNGSGNVQPHNNSAFGSGPVVSNAGQIYPIAGAYTYANALTLNGSTLRVGGGAGRSVTWTGPMTLAGDSTIQADGSTGGVKLSGDVSLAGFTLSSFSGGGSAGNTISGAISGAGGNLTVTGGLLEISSPSNDYTGTTTVSDGILRLGASNVLPDASAVTIENGTLNANNQTDIAGTLAVTGTATVNLDASGAVAFADSSGISWTGTLNIIGTFTPGTSLRFGNDANGLSSLQLAAITVAGGGSYTLNSSGYLVEATGGGYSDWATLNGATSDLNEDHDDDGVANGVEYFLGGPNGNTTGFTPLPGVTDTAGVLSVTWTKGADYTGAYGTDFFVETSPTLTNPWTQEAIPPASGANVTISGDDVIYTFPAGTRNFVRLRVNGP